MNETSYLEGLARRIEAAARTPNNKAKLFAIADDIRKYKDKRYSGGNFEELNPDMADAPVVAAVADVAV